MTTDAGTPRDQAVEASKALRELRATLEDGTAVAERAAAALADREAALCRLTELCTRVVRHLDTPIVVVDDALRVRMASPSAERLLGAGALTGRSLRDVVPPRLAGVVRRCIVPPAGEPGPGGDAAPAPARASLAEGRLRVTVERVTTDGPPQTWARFLPDRRPLTAADLPPAFGLVRLAPADGPDTPGGPDTPDGPDGPGRAGGAG